MTELAGYVKVHRRILSNPLFKRKPQVRHLFTDILLLAWHRPHTEDWNGPVHLERGELMATIRQLSELTGFSPKVVRNGLASLEAHNIVKMGKRPGNGPHVISVCNYSEYQADGQTKGKGSGKARAKGGQTIQEEPINTKNTQGDDRFDEFWEVFPRKRRNDPKGCRAKFEKIIRDGEATADQMIQAVKDRRGFEADPAMAVSPKVWLNQSRWGSERGGGSKENENVMDGMTPKEYQQLVLSRGR